MVDKELEKRIWQLFEEGLSDNEILDRIISGDGEDLTYMDLRILRADYEEEHPETVEEQEQETVTEDISESGSQGVGVSIDSIKKPGSLMSGKANLPSGAQVTWMLDRAGRINIQPDGAQQPTQEDMEMFQKQLRSELEKRGGVV